MDAILDKAEQEALNLPREEIFFKAQVDAGRKELDEGQGIPHEDVEKRMSKWLTR